ncbi:hypothetical protein BC938DRAFT_475459 [Jimgerdemannia flammicorona]|uniref:P-type ATPase C-terminal domain-containing protein n=1 Tax=Jimgerdemannia flammicorona TaxID=994334 RepID=A0A433PUK1_9FUNG|nr:hypothetical protein BC938DRAFT_475459 [Jimgerdemannia flammicorona]
MIVVSSRMFIFKQRLVCLLLTHDIIFLQYGMAAIAISARRCLPSLSSIVVSLSLSCKLFSPHSSIWRPSPYISYATLYTMAPVFSLVLDQDVNEDIALLYPELYKDLTKVRHLDLAVDHYHTAPSSRGYLLASIKVLIVDFNSRTHPNVHCAHAVINVNCIYIGGAIMILSILLFEDEFIHIVSISFTALIFNELLMVALEVNTWYGAFLQDCARTFKAIG